MEAGYDSIVLFHVAGPRDLEPGIAIRLCRLVMDDVPIFYDVPNYIFAFLDLSDDCPVIDDGDLHAGQAHAKAVAQQAPDMDGDANFVGNGARAHLILLGWSDWGSGIA
ncbi:hypothetical protein D9M70_504800 [compost metagenome]